MENGISKRAAATGRHAEAPEEQELPGLPAGWVSTTLGEIVQPSRMKANPQEHQNLPFVGLEHVEPHTMRLLGTVPSGAMKSSAFRFRPGDILYGRLRPYLNKVCRPEMDGLCSAEFIVFPIGAHLDARFLQYLLNSSAFVSFASHLNEGDRPRVDFSQIAPYRVCLPPLPEQRRIVAAIEEQFSRLDAGVAALERVRAALKRYRAAVLQAACTGRLVPTEAELARAEGRDYETAGRLLARIRTERRSRWEEEQRAKLAAAGKLPRNDAWKSKYQEPAPPDTGDLPKLPEGWEWATVEQLSNRITKGTSPGWQGFAYVDDGIGFLRSQNVQWGRLDLTDLAHLPEGFNASHPNSIIYSGDVLLNLVGASVGRSAIATDQLDGANTNQAVGIIRLIPHGVINSFLMYLFISPYGQSHIAATKVDVARANFNLDDIRPMPIPIPPLAEQERIVAEVERRLSVVEELEAVVDANLRRAGRLRQAILKRAFEGRLVPQDPNDEPASVLLERLRGEREDSTEGPMGGDRKTRLARSRRSKAR